jgi:aminopeptidase N
MSSYLFVLAAGELERATADADGVTVGVVATRGKGEHGRYALDTAVGLLRYYNEYFGIAYPLPKLDLIAVPGGFGGAMENWGGITFFESRLLFDPTTSASDARRGVFSIIAASWMQAKAAKALHPDWQTWLSGSGFKQAAMSAMPPAGGCLARTPPWPLGSLWLVPEAPHAQGCSTPLRGAAA